MLDVRYSAQFKKDFKLAKKRGLPLQELKEVIETLAREKTLDEKYADHPLKGKYASFRECHIRPDWLLILKNSLLTRFLVSSRGCFHDLNFTLAARTPPVSFADTPLKEEGSLP